MTLSKFLSDLNERTKTIKVESQYAEYRHDLHGLPGLRSAQVIALAERVCGIITQLETLCERMEALEKAADYPR